MVEYTQRDWRRVEIQRSVTSGENVVPRGSESKEGELLLSGGTRLTPSAIGLAASVGSATVSVYKRPRVAILSTGDEIIDVASSPGPNQIRNSNTYSLAAQVQAAGGMPLMLPIAPDRAEPLRELIEQGLEADLLLLSGGVSMGKYDLVERSLQSWTPSSSSPARRFSRESRLCSVAHPLRQRRRSPISSDCREIRFRRWCVSSCLRGR